MNFKFCIFFNAHIVILLFNASNTFIIIIVKSLCGIDPPVSISHGVSYYYFGRINLKDIKKMLKLNVGLVIIMFIEITASEEVVFIKIIYIINILEPFYNLK